MKVAFVTESLWHMGGANRVLETFCEMYPNADIYALFGDTRNISKKVQKHNIQYSVLNRFPFIKKYYRYTYPLWPLVIENFDLSSYDLVISSSSSVAHGAITSVNCQHIAYMHSPMRYAWDLKDKYFNKKNFGFLKKLIIPFFLNYLRTWDVVAAQRPDILISNSKFVSKRCKKYWDREVDRVIYPPVEMYTDIYGKRIIKQKENCFVSGSPLEPNKGGEFLLECAKELGLNLKIIGKGSLLKKFKRKYKKYPNIEFLGWITEKEKWNILSKAKGYILSGVEDFGIFPVEAISAGTPVLAFKNGGVMESVEDGVNGIFFEEQSLESFKKGLERFEKKKWEYVSLSKTVKQFSKENFVEKFDDILN